MANKDLTICGGRSKSLDESGFQFHLEAKCLQAWSHSSAFLVIKSGCGWIWGKANNYEIQIKFTVDGANKEACSHMLMSPPTLNISNTIIMCLWNRWKISPASTVFLQLGFWSRRVSAPVWPFGHRSQGIALTDYRRPWLTFALDTKQGNKNRPTKPIWRENVFLSTIVGMLFCEYMSQLFVF